MAVLIKTTEDGRKLTVIGTAIYLDGVKEADFLDPLIHHPNREAILKVAPDATHMAGRVALTWEQALAANAGLKAAREAYDSSPQGIAANMRRSLNKAMTARE
jgi:hypothetical protein